MECDVEEVSIDNCDLDNNDACKVMVENDYSIKMKFTPDFSGNNIEMLAFGYNPVQEKWDVFEEMNSKKDACNFMTCPVVNGQTMYYTYNLRLEDRVTYRNLPPIYNTRVQWRMTQNGVNRCCFENKISLVR